MNTELVATVNTNAAFAASGLRGVSFQFPWLSGLSSSFGKWRWDRVRFIYVPACPTSTPGTFSMSLQFDIADSNPATIGQQSQMYEFIQVPYWAGWEGAVCLNQPFIKPPAGSVVIDVDTARFDKPWYQMSNFTDFGATQTFNAVLANSLCPFTLISGTSGVLAINVLAGYLYAQYDIEMIEPIVSSSNF